MDKIRKKKPQLHETVILDQGYHSRRPRVLNSCRFPVLFLVVSVLLWLPNKSSLFIFLHGPLPNCAVMSSLAKLLRLSLPLKKKNCPVSLSPSWNMKLRHRKGKNGILITRKVACKTHISRVGHKVIHCLLPFYVGEGE